MTAKAMCPWNAGEKHERGLRRPEFQARWERPATKYDRSVEWLRHAVLHQALCVAGGSQASHAKRRSLFYSGDATEAQRMLDGAV